jgi:hypothetical protein
MSKTWLHLGEVIIPSRNTMMAGVYQALNTCQAMGQAFYFQYLNEFSHSPLRKRYHCTLQALCGKSEAEKGWLSQTMQLANDKAKV